MSKYRYCKTNEEHKTSPSLNLIVMPDMVTNDRPFRYSFRVCKMIHFHSHFSETVHDSGHQQICFLIRHRLQTLDISKLTNNKMKNHLSIKYMVQHWIFSLKIEERTKT